MKQKTLVGLLLHMLSIRKQNIILETEDVIFCSVAD